MKKKLIILVLPAILIISIIAYVAVIRTHTYSLTGEGTSTLKTEQIEPLFGTVRVSGDSDTDVVFRDVETGETFKIGYITHGMSEKITLQKGHWYTVEGAGTLTIGPVNLRVE